MQKRHLPFILGSLIISAWIAFIMLFTGKIIGDDLISEISGGLVAISIGVTNVLLLESLLRGLREKTSPDKF